MAAGLGFKTFTTGEVLTAANVNGYLMQGILVFANAAARDAAITSPQEGQACYLKDTDAVLTYSGSAWVAVGGTSGLTLVTSNTFSGATSISLNNVFSATYQNYFIATRFTSSGSTDQMVQMRLRVGGTDATTAEYVHDGFRGYPSSVVYFGGSLSRFELHNISSVNANNASHVFQLLGPAIADRTGIHSMGNGYTSVTYGTNTVHMSGSHAPATAYDGLTIFVTTGNIAGTIKVYGYAN